MLLKKDIRGRLTLPAAPKNSIMLDSVRQS